MASIVVGPGWQAAGAIIGLLDLTPTRRRPPLNLKYGFKPGLERKTPRSFSPIPAGGQRSGGPPPSRPSPGGFLFLKERQPYMGRTSQDLDAAAQEAASGPIPPAGNSGKPSWPAPPIAPSRETAGRGSDPLRRLPAPTYGEDCSRDPPTPVGYKVRSYSHGLS